MSPDLRDPDPLLQYMLPGLREYFQTDVDEVAYTLAGVANQPAGGDDVRLTPAAFAITSAADGDAGVLSVYIQTAESGNPVGDQEPRFLPGYELLPVPAGSSVGIILSHQLLCNVFLTPQLSRSGYTVRYNEVGEGIMAQLTSDARVISPGQETDGPFSDESYDGLDLTLLDRPLALTLSNGQMTVRWSASTRSRWSRSSHIGTGSNFQWGNVDLTIQVETPAVSLQVSSDGISVPDMTLDQSDFVVSARAQKCGTWDLGCSESVPDYYDKMRFTVPTISISMHGFNFLAASNLLFPDGHVIELDPGVGIRTPHDFLLAGTISR